MCTDPMALSNRQAYSIEYVQQIILQVYSGQCVIYVIHEDLPITVEQSAASLCTVNKDTTSSQQQSARA